jgi:predicted RNase H-like HicB family nuclease
MPHYIAIIEDAGPDKAIGIWFPDLPGCFSAGDDLDKALQHAPEAIALYAESLAREQKPLPRPRKLAAIRSDPAFAEDVRDHIVALVTMPQPADAAE